MVISIESTASASDRRALGMKPHPSTDFFVRPDEAQKAEMEAGGLAPADYRR